MSKFSERLTALRKARDLSQDDVAKLLNISRSRISMYEQGKRQPDFEMLEAIADFYNVNMDYLLCNDNNSFGTLADVASRLNQVGYDKLIEYARDLVLLYPKEVE